MLMSLVWCLEDAKCQVCLACSTWLSWGCFPVCLPVLLGVLIPLLPGGTPQVRTSQGVFRDLFRQSNTLVSGTRYIISVIYPGGS